MSQKIPYPYASGDLLENRNTYFYSQYQGEAFLSAWRNQRAAALTHPKGNVSTDAGADALSSTDRLLDRLGQDFSRNGATEETVGLLAALVQRFEITKRLHGEYNSNFRPTDPRDYHYLGRYLKFAEVLDTAYASTASLPYLNALLKCLDTLTALQQRLDAAQHERLQSVIEHEKDHVEKLSLKLTGGPHAD